MTEVCGQLSTHFETIGSPIMIGKSWNMGVAWLVCHLYDT